MRNKPIGGHCCHCRSTIPEKRILRHSKYCSNICRKDAEYKARCPTYEPSKVSSGVIGAMHELLVSADLMRRGYEVFRALSPACSCDLVILKEGRLLRVEVRTAQKSISGKLSWTNSKKDIGRSDMLALVVEGRDIVYLPSLDTIWIASCC